MTRIELIRTIEDLGRNTLVEGFYVDAYSGEVTDHDDFCREHADQVARVHALTTAEAAWIDSTSMGSDSHRECAFRGCGKHLDFGGLTDYGVKSALGLTEEDPHRVSCYPSELELAARAMANDDPRWELWEHHAKQTIAWEAARR